MQLIQHVTVSAAAGQAAIDFSSIPQTFDDLYLVVSARTNQADDNLYIQFNGNASSGYSQRNLLGVGSGNGISQVGSSPSVPGTQVHGLVNTTANTFGNASVYIPNYRSSSSKNLFNEGVSEANATASYQFLVAGIWANSSPITSIRLILQTGVNLQQHSSASLYGITRGTSSGVTVS